MIAPLVAALAICTPSWHVVPGVGGNATLGSVNASSPTDVWASGGRLLEHWDGTHWARLDAPAGMTVEDVQATSATDAWAVGTNGAAAAVAHWNGTTWTPTTLPPAVGAATTELGSAATRRLWAVAATAADDVWAVGADRERKIDFDHPYEAAVVLHWDGSTWAEITPPLGLGAALYDVAARSADDVWAVGEDYEHGTGIALHWNGSSWTVFHPHAPSQTAVIFESVAVTGANTVAVAADVVPDPGTDDFMGDQWGTVYRWNGRAWSHTKYDTYGSFVSYDAVGVGPGTWIAANDVDPEQQQAGTALFTTARPSRRVKLPPGHVIAALAFDGSSLWGVGWIGSGFAHPGIDYDYKTFRPLIMRYGCG